MSGHWLVQWHQYEVDDSIVHLDSVVTPALSRHLREISVSDRVVLWMTGAGDTAGVWALGEVVSEVHELDHRRDYGDPDSPRGLRPSVEVALTHRLETDLVRRTDLRQDERFDGFTLFKRGGARGTGPWSLTPDQWAAILERVPVWAALDRPEADYLVSIDFLTRALNKDAARQDLAEVIRDKRYDELTWEIASRGQASAAWERLDVPAVALPDVPGALQAATFQLECRANAAVRAYLSVLKQLRADPDGSLDAGEILL